MGKQTKMAWDDQEPGQPSHRTMRGKHIDALGLGRHAPQGVFPKQELPVVVFSHKALSKPTGLSLSGSLLVMRKNAFGNVRVSLHRHRVHGKALFYQPKSQSQTDRPWG